MRQFSEAEANLSSVERILYYTSNVPNEAPAVVAKHRPEKSWPAQGAMEFSNFVMKYRPDLPPVLNGLTLSIKAGEKVGIVGRTGAGKSSMMLAVYRIVEASEGSISIDGITISSIGLGDLRKKLAIIPQEPV